MRKGVQGFVALLRALSEQEARFMVVGAHAVAHHGHLRATEDLDLWIDNSPGNASRVYEALAEAGALTRDISVDALTEPGVAYPLGEEPFRIDILTEIRGVAFDDAWPRRVTGRVHGEPCPVLGLDDLLANKRATGRLKDLLDAESLERVHRRRG
ncbi:nucleotidyltransferase [Nannocystis sp. RBIL2]|uniref:nucleotidyltransferase n=1 Tax=Nannocystis sp. RBIL2 TaxID=2996788 RepID=UPI00226DCAEF|nr:nucleotidyltransferase [Nannocystis sp. RBIL2]MCY1069773.1 nucleotidyltransferase [Nannocystis sp. RBIL2]